MFNAGNNILTVAMTKLVPFDYLATTYQEFKQTRTGNQGDGFLKVGLSNDLLLSFCCLGLCQSLPSM